MNVLLNRSLSLITGILIIASISGCHPTSYLGVKDLSSLYNPKKVSANFSCTVFNLNDSVSRATFRIPYDDLSFKADKQDARAYHRIKLSCLLFHSFQDRQIVDSISRIYQDTLTNTPGYLFIDLDLKAASGSNYLLQCELTDLNTGNSSFRIQNFLKVHRSDAGWFRLEGEKRGTLYENYLSTDEKVRICASDTGLKVINCRAFFDIFPAALPPFIDKERQPFDYKFDSTFRLPLYKGFSSYISLPRQGFYIFQSDTSGTDGITFFRMYPAYPKIANPVRMIEPLRYLTSTEEFNQLLSGAYPKETVDSFWVATAGGPDRAVELIRSYYNRIEEANRLFLSYCEGWKTDRGLIYIIFGPPNVVYRSDQEEAWIYGEANNYHSIRFDFLKVLNPFTQNDYILQRQAAYKDIWYNAVQQWRR